LIVVTYCRCSPRVSHGDSPRLHGIGPRRFSGNKEIL